MIRKKFAASFLLFALSYIFSYASSGEVSVIEALPRRNAAVIDIEITKIKTHKVTARHYKEAAVIEFHLDEPLEKKVAVLENLREESVKRGRIRNTPQEQNISYSFEKGENGKTLVRVNYKNFPSSIYAAALGNGNTLEKLYKVERYEETVQAKYEMNPNFLGKNISIDIIDRKKDGTIKWLPNAERPEAVEILLGRPVFKRSQGNSTLYMGVSARETANGVLEFPIHQGTGRAEFYLKQKGSDEKEIRIPLEPGVDKAETELWVKMDLKDLLLAQDLNFEKDVKLYVSDRTSKARSISGNREEVYDVPSVMADTDSVDIAHFGNIGFYRTKETTVNQYELSFPQDYTGGDIDISLGNLSISEVFALWSNTGSSTLAISNHNSDPAPGGNQSIVLNNKINFIVKDSNNKNITITADAYFNLEKTSAAGTIVSGNTNNFVSAVSALNGSEHDSITSELRIRFSKNEIDKFLNNAVNGGQNQVSSENKYIYFIGAPTQNNTSVSYQIKTPLFIKIFKNYRRVNFPTITLNYDDSQIERNTAQISFGTKYRPGSTVNFPNGVPNNEAVSYLVSGGGNIRGFEGSSNIEVTGLGKVQTSSDGSLGLQRIVSNGITMDLGFESRGILQLSLVDWTKESKSTEITMTHERDGENGKEVIINKMTIVRPYEYLEVSPVEPLDFGTLYKGSSGDTTARTDIKIKTRSQANIGLSLDIYGESGGKVNYIDLENVEDLSKPGLRAENLSINNLNSTSPEERNFELSGIIKAGNIDKAADGNYQKTVRIKIEVK